MSYFKKPSWERSPSKRYIALAAEPSIAMWRCSPAKRGILGDAPHRVGSCLTLESTLMREKEFHRIFESGIGDSIWSLTIESLKPKGWTSAFPMARTAKMAVRANGRLRMRKL